MTFEDAEYALRERCREICARHPGLPRLQTIAAVGAYDGEIGRPDKDSHRLTEIMNYLLDSGYLIDPGFEIDVVNFREGRDFLREDKKVDLVFVAYILDCRPFNDAETFRGQQIDNQADLSTMLSWRNHTSGWMNRLEEAEVKVIATYGGIYEIGTNFLKYNETVLIPSPEEECAGSYTNSQQEIRKLYPALKDIDLPIGWLGFLANPEYLKAIAPALNKQTCLGRRGLDPQRIEDPNPTGFDVVTRSDVLLSPPRSDSKSKKREEQVPAYRQLKSNRAYRFR